jgi:hypothetical protein
MIGLSQDPNSACGDESKTVLTQKTIGLVRAHVCIVLEEEVSRISQNQVIDTADAIIEMSDEASSNFDREADNPEIETGEPENDPEGTNGKNDRQAGK